jgi:N-carbamoyl-L-amino-acid hydrolase
MTMTTRHSHLSTARGAQKEVDAPGSTPGVSGLSLDLLNEATGHETALTLLAGLYEHSDWVIERALAARPFQSPAHFRQVCRDVVTTASLDEQLALIRAHPELTGKAKIDPGLARDSKSEQQAVGLDRCSLEELEALTQLNARYKEKFGWPFILAVRGPRGLGLTRGQIINALERRLEDPPDQERKECLHQIHRIAEMRLNERFGIAPVRGEKIWDDCQALSSFSEDTQGLTVSYLTNSHQQVAHWLIQSFKDAGFQQVHQDAVGNVVGRWGSPPYLLTGSHFDTVRNGGRYDGRLGIMVALEFVRQKNNGSGLTGPGIELVAFAEEEGVRYAATFLGSSALTGSFQKYWLDA